MIEKYAIQLEALYLEKNRRCYVHPDPLEFLYQYPEPADSEVAGFVAASLAYGNVFTILKSVKRVLDIMGPHPDFYLRKADFADFMLDFSGFVHRFAKTEQLAGMLSGMKSVATMKGSLMEYFRKSCSSCDASYVNALQELSLAIRSGASSDPGHLVPAVEKKSACKRLNLYLRWMIRKDDVDPGTWHALCPSKLIVPLDVHMHRTSLDLGLTKRRQAGMKTALEITKAFSQIVPEDPVRYDFVLTRSGIRKDDTFSLQGFASAPRKLKI